MLVSSPRAWGCFHVTMIYHRFTHVFPTCVGVFLPTLVGLIYPERLPHVRGGVSTIDQDDGSSTRSSPCAWGCFHARAAPNHQL